MHGDALRHPDSDCGYLAVRSAVIGSNPDTTSPFDATGIDAEFLAHGDQQGLEASNERNDIQRLGQANNRIAHQLAGAMPGDLAAAVHVDHLGIAGDRPGTLMGFGASTSGVHRRMLQEQNMVRGACHHAGMNLTLYFPTLQIVHWQRTEVVDDQAGRRAGQTWADHGIQPMHSVLLKYGQGMAWASRCVVVAVISLGMMVSAQGQSWAAEVINGCAIIVNARCPGADLSSSNLADANLTGADLESVSFEAANLTRATFVNANLTKAWLGRAVADAADFTNANLTGIQGYGALFGYAKFDGAVLDDAVLIDQANLDHASFAGAKLRNAEFADVYGKYSAAKVRNANFRGANLTDAYAKGVDFTGSSFAGTTSLGDAVLSSALLNDVDFQGAGMGGTVLTGAQMNGAAFDGNFMNAANLARGSAQSASLRRASLFSANLSGLTADGANLRGADLAQANLAWARFAGGVLAEADLTGANLYGTNFNGANMRGVKMSMVDIMRPTFECDEQTQWSGRYKRKLEKYCGKNEACPIILWPCPTTEQPCGSRSDFEEVGEAWVDAVFAECFPNLIGKAWSPVCEPPGPGEPPKACIYTVVVLRGSR